MNHLTRRSLDPNVVLNCTTSINHRKITQFLQITLNNDEQILKFKQSSEDTKATAFKIAPVRIVELQIINKFKQC